MVKPDRGASVSARTGDIAGVTCRRRMLWLVAVLANAACMGASVDRASWSCHTHRSQAVIYRTVYRVCRVWRGYDSGFHTP